MTRASKVLAAFVGVILVVLGATSVRTALIEYRSLAGWPQSLPLPTDASGRQPARVSWESASGRVNAWHLVGTNGGGVVLIHGSGGNRSNLVDEMFALGNAGFSVLAVDLPGHGESEGRVDYSGQNRTVIGEAVRFLLESGAVRSVGLFGFSLGGYQALQVAAVRPEVRAVAVAGSPASLREQACSEYPFQCLVTLAPVVLAMKLRGLDPTDTPGLEAAGALHGSPLLVIHGADDQVVPQAHARALFDAANEPKELLLLHGAQHGNYGRGAPNEYPLRVIEFFQRTLGAIEGSGVTQ